MFAETIRLKMKDWYIEAPNGLFIGFAGEVDGREIVIDTNAPDHFNYKLEVECDKKKNTMDMVREGNTLRATIKAEMVKKSGFCSLQVRGVDGQRVLKSNTINAKVHSSINASEEFDEFMPSEFLEMENRVTESAKMATDISQHPPIPSSDGYWMVWDYYKQEYVKTDTKMPGPNDEVIRFDAAVEVPDEEEDFDKGELEGDDVIYFSDSPEQPKADDDEVIKF